VGPFSKRGADYFFGAPGTGKTRLAQEAIAMAQQDVLINKQSPREGTKKDYPSLYLSLRNVTVDGIEVIKKLGEEKHQILRGGRFAKVCTSTICAQ
jgi:hypothetical protein